MKSGGGNISNNLLSNGSSKGQILYITNEDAGTIDLNNTNTIGNVTIGAKSAIQLLWLGNNWVILNR
ncbi:MAG: hypothetical protein CVV25_08120 [Ignavibacteriae bacterium HGW-Ignavibacteriae-4]|nr:MAG: hypothetical protein CVV25_08120 [Ignavibacteriae bacterium HGW-Ignavibacteriae-4]